MNPLIAIAAALFPEILKAVAGDGGGRIAATVTKAVTDVAGTTDPVEAERKVTQDPEAAAKLRTELARIALEETKMRLEGEQNQRDVAFAELKARLEDEQRQRESNLAARRLDHENTAGARTFVGALSSEKSPIAWVAPTLSLLVVVGFFSILVMFVALKQYLEAAPAPSIPIGLDAKALTPEQIRAFGTDRSDFVVQIINICVGALAAAFATVMSFWLGSSQGSRAKDDLVADLQKERASEATELIKSASTAATAKTRPPAPDKPMPPNGSGPGSPPTGAPGGDAAPIQPVKPAPPGLLAEIIPELIKSHRHFPTSVSWALVARGVSVEGAPAKGTAGEPTTVRKIWQRYGSLCAASARKYGVPVELIVATIATESSGDPNARRAEPRIGDESVGLMQTLVRTARGATGRRNLNGDDLLEPATSIDAGTAYIAQQRSDTHFDPPLVAAAYNAGSIRRDDGQANRWKLHCHPRGTGQHIDRFVAWFSDCMRVSGAERWARDENIPSFAAAFRSAGAGDDKSSPDYPPPPDFPPLLSTEERQLRFGNFAFEPAPTQDNPERIRIVGDWTQKNIVSVSIPIKQVLGKAGPFTIEFHREAADQLTGLWLEWEKVGLLDRIVSFDGGFVPRFMRKSTTKLSNHAFGTAFDINAEFNQLGAEPALVGERGSVRELVHIANKYGFFWGGHFRSRLDGMHFEVAKIIQPDRIV